MNSGGATCFVLAAMLLIPAVVCAAGPETNGHTNAVWREDFASIEGWQPLTFPKIERHTRYSVTNVNGRTVLKAEADASASGLVRTNAFDPHVTPVLRWRWRVHNVLPKGDAARKDGDDYRAAFGEDPPKRARLAIMSDADNTGGVAVGFLDFMEIIQRPEQEGEP